MRMRVAMQRHAWPHPCDNVTEGEIEDYTIKLHSPVLVEQLPSVVVSPNPASHEAYISWNNLTVYPDELQFIECGGLIKSQVRVADRNSYYLPLDGCSDGLYYVVLKRDGLTLQIVPMHISK